MWDKEKLNLALSKNLIHCNIDESFQGQEVIIDSRKKTNGGIFIAFKGQNNDGHNYLQQAFDNGAKIAIVSKILDKFKDDNRIILVKDSNQALIDLAIYSRQNFKGKIIGITGSVGKSSIKEMLKTILSFKNSVFANYGNLNNHIGLPLSLCNLDQNADYGIFEMGMNHLKEIEFLSNIAKPDIAIISNIAAAHIGNFKNEEEIALAKSEIFYGLTQNDTAILNKDNKHFDFLNKKAQEKTSNIITFGKNEESDICLKSFDNIDNENSKISVIINKKEINYEINNINESVISNSLIALATLKALNKNITDYLPAFKNLQTPKGRGNIIKIGKITIIDDSYNANLTSMISGLKFLSDIQKQNSNSRSIAILGDMLELGEKEIEEHKSIAKYIDEFNINKVLLVGNLTKHTASQLKSEKILGHFKTSDELAKEIKNIIQDNDIILVKASRSIKMEKIIETLE